MSRKLRLFLFGLLASTRYKNHEVICISNREEHCPPSFTVRHACPQRRRRSVTLAASLEFSTMVSPPLVSFLDDAEGDVGEQRRDHTTLGSAFVCRKQEAVRQNSGLQELRDQPRDLTIGDASTNPLHQLVVIDVVEAAPDISFDDPLVGRPLTPAILCRRPRSHAHPDMLQGAMAASSGPKPVRHM